jgi:phosphoglycerate dehydrogenase-like enzyme
MAGTIPYVVVTAHLGRDITFLIYRPDDWPAFLAQLEKTAPVTVRDGSIDELAPLVEGLVCWQVPEELLDGLSHLQWIQTTTSGADHLDAFLERRGRRIMVSTVKGMNADAVAEYALLAILARKWRLPMLLEQQRKRTWRVHATTPSALCTCAIVGVGEIGGRLARHVHGLGMRVLGVRRSPAAHPAVDEMFTFAELEAVLSRADFVVLALPLTNDTTKLIGARELSWMKAGSCLINVSRGGVVDEAALLSALEQQTIAGAVLDVTRIEPCPPDSPLWHAPNLVLTPHLAGQRSDYSEAAARIWVDNVHRYAVGERPRPVYRNG